MKRWYVIQVYAGHEERVCEDLLSGFAKQGQPELYGNVVAPSAKFKDLLASTETKNQRLLPGYVLVELELCLETQRFVLNIPRVLRFLGGKNPMPLSPAEVERITSNVQSELIVNAGEVDFSPGLEVEITEGPFAGFVGIVDRVDKDAERLVVMVSIFGRLTPVELNFSQVKH
jgi:transcriptional antiterminator NusG